MKVTLQQIAATAGVSVATVSRVLNRRPGVEPESRRKIIAAIRETGYRRRNEKRRSVIALIVPGSASVLLHGYLSSIITALTEEIFRLGHQMELIPARDIELLDDEVVSGAISLMFTDGIEKWWGQRFHLPLVGINCSSYHLDGVYSVCSNEQQGMGLAVRSLAGFGHRRLGLLIDGAPNCWCGRERRDGFTTACTARNLAGFVAEGSIYEALGELIRNRVTGIVCTGENSGMVASYALHSFGYRVPQDLSIISHELESVSQYCIPRQTTIYQNFRELSRNAVLLLGKLLAGERPEGDLLIDYQLIERDTVSAPTIN